MTHRLDPLLRPASVAVVGASENNDSLGDWSLQNLVKGGFSGDLYAVNPNYEEVQGIACFPSLADLPAVPELVIFAVGDRRYADGKWSVKEVLLHLADAERVFAYRALRFARRDTTELSGFDEPGEALRIDAGMHRHDPAGIEPADDQVVSDRLRDRHHAVDDVALEGTIRNWVGKPTIAAKIESNQMDIDLLIPKSGRSPVRDALEWLAANSKVSATASIARGHYKHLKFGGLSARITIQDGVLDIDRVSGQSTNGGLAGRLVFQLPRLEPAEGEVSLRATGLLVKDMFMLAGAEEGGITGEARVTGTMRGHGRNPHGLYPSLNGKAEVLLENGRIFKSKERAIWKIVSILNLPAVLQGKVDLEKEGLPYNKITATVTVRDGMFETENLIVDSPIVKITAAGNYDLPTDQVDMVWAVSPFGSYSQFLKTIPLFGRLFAGERKGFATAIFSVKGALEDPEVTYLPMKSFAAGFSGLTQLAVDVLKNTVMLPIDLITPDENQPVSKDVIPNREPVPATP